jgi:hypothetical protein
MNHNGMIEFQPLYKQSASDAPFGDCPSGMPRPALDLPDRASQCADGRLMQINNAARIA